MEKFYVVQQNTASMIKDYGMVKDYNEATAKHYASYRPPLHQLILEKCMDKLDKLEIGLDIGCGTGQSSIALSQYCQKVIGIDPSSDMLGRAIPDPGIEYHPYDQKKISFQSQYFDIITLAGSLFYAKSQRLLDEIIRVNKSSSPVIVYDFEILLDDLYLQLAIDPQTTDGIYNYKEDFSGLNGKIKLVETSKEEVTLNMEPTQLAHLLLSLGNIYKALEKKYKVKDPFPMLEEELNHLSNGNLCTLKALIYFTKYKCP